jgi:hypothetical protein
MLGIPVHKPDISVGTALAALQSGAADLEICHHFTGISLLANNFNRLFISAWEGGFDYLVLLHSDIGVHPPLPGQSWVSRLVQLTRDYEVAACSAVVPIKSMDGLTSTALQLRQDTPYAMRRLAMMELRELPETKVTRKVLCDLFGVLPEVAGPLLVNTGCLCIDLRRYDWAGAKWPGFKIVDELAWNTTCVPAAFVEPEDWNFSRWMHDKGWPYCATTEIVVDHHGSLIYSSCGNWGRPADDFSRTLSVLEYEAT